MTRTVSFARRSRSAAMISPWKLGWEKPSTISCTGPMAMFVLLSHGGFRRSPLRRCMGPRIIRSGRPAAARSARGGIRLTENTLRCARPTRVYGPTAQDGAGPRLRRPQHADIAEDCTEKETRDRRADELYD